MIIDAFIEPTGISRNSIEDSTCIYLQACLKHYSCTTNNLYLLFLPPHFCSPPECSAIALVFA